MDEDCDYWTKTPRASSCPNARSYEEALKDLWGEEVAKGGEDAYPLP